MTNEMNDLLQAVAAEWGQGSQEHNIARDVCKLANKEIEALTAASTALRDDLLSRAEWDKDAGKVVCAGNGVWLKFNEALEKQP